MTYCILMAGGVGNRVGAGIPKQFVEVIGKPVETISETKYVQFGNRKLPIPIGYDSILKNLYGDYMVPPSNKNKESTHKNEIYIEICK